MVRLLTPAEAAARAAAREARGRPPPHFMVLIVLACLVAGFLVGTTSSLQLPRAGKASCGCLHGMLLVWLRDLSAPECPAAYPAAHFWRHLVPAWHAPACATGHLDDSQVLPLCQHPPAPAPPTRPRSPACPGLQRGRRSRPWSTLVWRGQRPGLVKRLCEDSCAGFTRNGVCDEGRPTLPYRALWRRQQDPAQSVYQVHCDLGTDCGDCGTWVRRRPLGPPLGATAACQAVRAAHCCRQGWSVVLAGAGRMPAGCHVALCIAGQLMTVTLGYSPPMPCRSTTPTRMHLMPGARFETCASWMQTCAAERQRHWGKPGRAAVCRPQCAALVLAFGLQTSKP